MLENLLFNYLYTFPNATDGIDSIVVQIITEVPLLPGMILTFIFFVTFLSGAASQTARTGTADYPAWCTTAALLTFISALIMTLTAGVINITILSIVIVLTIFSGVWLFLDRKSSEV